jgi:hypothetical protein
MHNLNKINGYIVFSPKNIHNKFYDSFIPTNNIYHQINLNIIRQILEKQKKI